MTTEPDIGGMSLSAMQPYPGLRYYRPDQDAVFAGRDREADACARLILQSNLTILHGLTGCGKSSFLRAGVRRRIEDSGLGFKFEAAEDRGAFPVIRSTATPLRELMSKVLAACDDMHRDGACGFGQLRPGHEDAVAAMIADEELRRYALTDSPDAMKVMRIFTAALSMRPILVIDQAEEVFTLIDAENDVVERRRLETERQEYFDLLGQLSRGGGPRIVVSLRTEYKGRFDDGVAADGRASATAGFYLDELNQDGLIAAILSPTRNAQEWSGDASPPYETFRFRYEEGVPQKLAEKLADKNKVPSGGVLPTLQVACLRLWRHAVRNTRPGLPVVVRRRHLNRMGDISRQIEVYLEESLEDSCAQVPEWAGSVTELVPEWHRLLARILVRRLPDGRAVSQSLDQEAVTARAVESLKARRLDHLDEGIQARQVEEVLQRLSRESVGILRAEGGVADSGADSGKAQPGRWMLGHDSLALALHNWVSKNGGSAPSMMMMMGANTPDRFTQDQLFLEDEKPFTTHLYVLDDYAWDHQIPQFGRSYAQRLGFEVRTTPELSVFDDGGRKAARTWPELRKRLSAQADRSNRQQDARRRGLHVGGEDETYVHSRVLAASDWDSFSAASEDMAGRSPEEITRQRGVEASKWSDLLVTDMYLGSGLVGAGLEDIPSIDAAVDLDEPTLTARIAGMLDGFMEKKALFRVANDGGRNFLAFAAWLVDRPDFIDYLGQEGVVTTTAGSEYTAEDPLVKWQSEGDEDQPRYFIGSSFARALAMQSGAEILFSAKHLAKLCTHEMNRLKRGAGHDVRRAALPEEKPLCCTRPLAYPGRADRQPLGVDLASDMQSIVEHTLWLVNVPAAQWRNGLNRAFILRLASVGYFTVEQVRSRMEAFIGHLHTNANTILANATDEAKASRLYRDIIQATVRDGFDFLRFDDYGERRYDLDSIHAYWSDHGPIGAKSVAGEIYQELCALRTQTLSHFNGVAHSIAWLRWYERYHPKNPDIAEAYKLKELAWNNFRIFNFFDAERYMGQAAAKLEGLVQKHGY